jgi:threonine dehydrogenase-like Zn-dependent dehydrogenase
MRAAARKPGPRFRALVFRSDSQPCSYPRALSLLATKKIDVLPLISHHFPWTSGGLAAGFNAAGGGDPTAIKVMFRDLAPTAARREPAC